MKSFKFSSLTPLLLTSFLAPQAAWSLEYNLVTPLPASQKTIVLNFLESGKKLLPKVVQDSVKKINVGFDDIRDGANGKVAGNVSRFSGKMTLSKSMIADIVAGESNSKKTNRVHQTVYKEALATLLHETIHVYDNLNQHTREEQEWIRRCNPVVSNEKQQQSIQDNLPAVCSYYKNVSQTLSQNPYFLFASGFIQDFNGLKERSPDVYELSNSKEALAVNMEYFLLDPQFKCRRPTMYRLLSSHFQHVPFEGTNCDRALSFVLPNSGKNPAQMLNIDPARVYQVHYLLADKGESMMSGWGHAMIRLVICAPNKPVGPNCMLDLEHHVVLSYRAFVDSLSLSSMDGLTGKYPSRLFIIPLSQIVDEYAKGELRALKSLPIKLSRKEIEDVVTRSVESHWAYNGKYYFVSNNCATESLNLIRSAVFNFDLLKVEVKTPIDLYASFLRLGADESVLKDRSFAIENGYYFDSYAERYAASFKFLKETLNLPEQDFRAFLDLKAAKRLTYIKRIPKNAANGLQIYANFMVLEAASQKKMQMTVTGYVQKIALQAMNDAEDKKKNKTAPDGNLVNLAQSYLELSQLFAKPSDFLTNQPGYGLPSKDESLAAKSGILSNGARAAQIEVKAKETMQSLISAADLRELEDLKVNSELLATDFRELRKKR